MAKSPPQTANSFNVQKNTTSRKVQSFIYPEKDPEGFLTTSDLIWNIESFNGLNQSAGEVTIGNLQQYFETNYT